MKFNPEKHHRKSIRLRGHDYSQMGAYFVTICTEGRECFFGDVINERMILNQNGDIVRSCWFELFKTFNNIKSPASVIMPNHIHGLIVLQYQVKNHKTQVDKADCRGLIYQTPGEVDVSSFSSNPGNVDVSAEIHQTPRDIDVSEQVHKNPGSDSVQEEEWILMRNPSLTLGKIIRHFKAQVTVGIRKKGAGHFQWQKNYHEEIIRDSKQFEQKRHYIRNNPSDWKTDEENPININKTMRPSNVQHTGD